MARWTGGRSRPAKRVSAVTPVVEDIDLEAEGSSEGSAQGLDLEAMLADHTFGPDAAAAVAQWSPSRRGNSPHHPQLDGV